MLTGTSYRPGGASFVPPALDILETDDSIEFVAQLCGTEKIDLEIRFERDVLTIRGREAKTGLRRGPGDPVGRFHLFHELELNHPVDVDKATAALDSGVLRLSVPRMQTNRRKRLEVGPALPGARLRARSAPDRRP